MRKILATLLALIMMISAIPLTIAHAATVTAPTTLPDGTEIVLISITDGTLTNPGTNESNISKFASEFDNTTKTIFDDISSIDTTICSGMLLRVDSETSNSPQWRFWFTYESGATYGVDKKPFYWWNGSTWSTGGTATNCSVSAAEAYIYVDFEELGLTETVITNLKIYTAKSATRKGTFSEWSLVQTKEQAENYPLVPKEEEESIAAPTTFPNTTTTMLYKSITDGTSIKVDGTATTTYSKEMTDSTYNIFNSGAQNLASYRGLLIKVTETGAQQLYLRFKLDFAETQAVDLKALGRSLYLYDGAEWKELTSGATSSNWSLGAWGANTAKYVYLPFDVLSAEFEANGTSVDDIMVYSSSNGDSGRTGIFSEWSLVYTADQIITSASVSLTDDLAWNVKANAPDGCTDGTMTFSFNGSNTTAALTNGRYSLTGILPQQIGMEITATWTGTVNGVTVTDSVTSSIESYCRTILATEAQADWHELAKALLHYGAAAQAATGVEGAPCNDGVDAVTNPVDLTAINPVITNNDTAVWKGATLRLDGALALKIRLDAPAGVTKVTATVDGRDSVELDIVDGYVVLPLNAYELFKTVTFSYGDADKTLVMSADYVLKNTTNSAYVALAKAVANYGSEAMQKKA